MIQPLAQLDTLFNNNLEQFSKWRYTNILSCTCREPLDLLVQQDPLDQVVKR